MKFVITIIILIASSWVQTDRVSAGELSTDQMIEALQPKSPSRTRTLKGSQQPSLSTEDQKFINQLKGQTRAIIVEERKKLIEVVKKYDMPQFDLEIYFDFNSSNIAQQAIPTLIKLGKALSDPSVTKYNIIVSGHTDAIGSDDYNQKLSESRAYSVKKFLVDNFQIDPYRLIAVGYGEEQLKNIHMPDADENRRVSIVNVGM